MSETYGGWLATGKERGEQRLKSEETLWYPAAMVNVTNRCNLKCIHCYLYTDGNPHDMRDQIGDAALLEQVEALRDKHEIQYMVWMGGEPMLRWRLLEKGVSLFPANTITTNGTVPLKDFGPTVTYVISIDGPEDLNDALRGDGVFQKARKTILAVPEGFSSTIQIQTVVTRQNQHRLEELLKAFLDTPTDGIAFSFFCPNVGEQTELAWESIEAREEAVDLVLALKARYPGFVWNSTRALELMRAPTARLVTDHCPAARAVMPLYVEEQQFVTPRCCYGNQVDCDRCGGWVVFSMAAKLPGPWDAVLPPEEPYGEMAAYMEIARQLELQMGS